MHAQQGGELEVGGHEIAARGILVPAVEVEYEAIPNDSTTVEEMEWNVLDTLGS